MITVVFRNSNGVESEATVTDENALVLLRTIDTRGFPQADRQGDKLAEALEWALNADPTPPAPVPEPQERFPRRRRVMKRRDEVGFGDVVISSHGYALLIVEVNDTAELRTDERMVQFWGHLHGDPNAPIRTERYSAGSMIETWVLIDPPHSAAGGSLAVDLDVPSPRARDERNDV